MYDLLVIGGGINGCGIARDAAGRGLSVMLAEKGDLASGTSSASTKLIHGGLRYLEHYEFRMVREALSEREVLLVMAPHIISPLRFVLPHHKSLRPAWLIRIGLFLYDHLGGRRILPSSRQVELTLDVAGPPLKGEFTRGFEYSDCWVDDARLVVLNAVDAHQRGATIKTRCEVVSAERHETSWKVVTKNTLSGKQETHEARALINAAGPWVDDVLRKRIHTNRDGRMRLVKGSHIIVPRIFEHDKAYIFQNADRRIVFAIPYEQAYTLIGTTDIDYTGDPGNVQITQSEIDYLCQSSNIYFKTAVHPSSIVWSYSGVRPLLDEGRGSAQEATRDFVLELDDRNGAPLLNVFGGKITTYRRLAEEALSKLSGAVSVGHSWTAQSRLPGGDFSVDGLELLAAELHAACPYIDAATARRLARSYGTVARKILAEVHKPEDLGEPFGAGLSEREVRHLVKNEWAVTSDDILWRRTKLGLRLDASGRARLDLWLKQNEADVAFPVR